MSKTKQEKRMAEFIGELTMDYNDFVEDQSMFQIGYECYEVKVVNFWTWISKKIFSYDHDMIIPFFKSYSFLNASAGDSEINWRMLTKGVVEYKYDDDYTLELFKVLEEHLDWDYIQEKFLCANEEALFTFKAFRKHYNWGMIKQWMKDCSHPFSDKFMKEFAKELKD